MTHMSQDPVTLLTPMCGGLIMCLVAVSLGRPVMSAKNVEEKSISGDTEVIAAVSFTLLHFVLLT
ncbi:hypothetical protein [Rhodococcus qingshengii]|uniref:hypothetical protein n=1 Tax=Rhodococcus qingshengii TaxID=334542 RepID=UPI0035D8EAE2